MSNINSLLESSASGWKNMQSDAARLAAKWGKTGLLEGLGSEVEKTTCHLSLKTKQNNLLLNLQLTLLVLVVHLVLELVHNGLELLFHWYVRYSVQSLQKSLFLYNL
jgi:hypothetical protein